MKFFVLLISIFSVISCSKKDEKGILSFQNCRVEYPIYANGTRKLYEGYSISNNWEFESARRELAICLCDEYLKHPNRETKEKILEIYREKEDFYSKDYPEDLDFKIILEKRNDIFNPKILID